MMNGETGARLEGGVISPPESARKAKTRHGFALCQDGRIIEDHGETIRIFVPMEIRKRSGRKVIIEPDTPHDDKAPSPLVVALARAYVWQKAIDEGKFKDAKELSLRFGVDPSRVRKILRLSLLSPRIVEAALEGNEPEIPLETLLDMDMPVGWEEQWCALHVRTEGEAIEVSTPSGKVQP